MNSKLWLGILSGAALLALHGVGDAHRTVSTPCSGSECCSPHGAVGSQGGSTFSECFAGAEDFNRKFNCDSETACSLSLCGSGQLACGFSYSNGTTSHGGGGGHKAAIDNFSCVTWSKFATCTPQW